MIALRVCHGLGMRICESCARNADNLPEGTIYGRTINPMADPPKCADWVAVPLQTGREV